MRPSVSHQQLRQPHQVHRFDPVAAGIIAPVRQWQVDRPIPTPVAGKDRALHMLPKARDRGGKAGFRADLLRLGDRRLDQGRGVFTGGFPAQAQEAKLARLGGATSALEAKADPVN